MGNYSYHGQHQPPNWLGNRRHAFQPHLSSGTVDLLNRTQERLSTGKKVNTALDNSLNFFTAKDINSRAADLAGYKDGMSEAVQTIKAANAGISAIEGLLAQAKAVAATAKAGVAGTVNSITVDLASVTNGQTIKKR